MSFGFSVSDFVTLGQLAWKAYKSCKDAPQGFQDISQEVLSLSAVLREAEETFSGQALSAGTQEGLKTVRDGCYSVLRDLQSLLDRYESLGTQSKRTWDRVGWCSNDIAELRSRLISNTGLLTAFISTSQVAVARKLTRFLQEFEDGTREGSVITNQTVESLSIDEQQIWRSIRKELEDIGITVAAFDSNKEFIMDWFKDAISTGAFGEREAEDIPSDGFEDDIAAEVSREDLASIESGRIYEGDMKQPLEASRYLISNQQTTDTSPSSWEITQRVGTQRARIPRVLRLAAILLRYDKACIESARYGREAGLKLLLERGADIEAKDPRFGRTPLLWAARVGHKAVVKLLLEKGADIEAKDKELQTPLLLAARYGREAVIKMLLEKGANIEAKDKELQTPLLWAASGGHEAVAKLLLEKGAKGS